MWSVPSRLREPSAAARTLAGVLSITPGSASGVRHQAELRRHHDLVAAALDRPADQFLVEEGAVDLGGVEVGDAQIQCPVDGADRFGVAAFTGVVVAGHRHRTQADPGDVELAERDVFHQLLHS